MSNIHKCENAAILHLHVLTEQFFNRALYDFEAEYCIPHKSGNKIKKNCSETQGSKCPHLLLWY